MLEEGAEAIKLGEKRRKDGGRLGGEMKETGEDAFGI